MDLQFNHPALSTHSKLLARLAGFSLLVVLLSGCKVGEPNRTICNIVMQNPNAPNNAKIECTVGQVAWWLADAPVIGPLLVTPILAQIPPDQNWIAGGVAVLAVLVCCCAAGSES